MLSGRVFVRPRHAMRREPVVGAVANVEEREAAVVGGVRPDRLAPAPAPEAAAETAAALRDGGRAAERDGGQHTSEARAGAPTHASPSSPADRGSPSS